MSSQYTLVLPLLHIKARSALGTNTCNANRQMKKKNAVVPVVVTTQPIKSIVTLQKHPPINHHLLGALLLPPLRLS